MDGIKLTKYQKSTIPKCLQKWYNAACWCGYATTFLGELSEYRIKQLAKEYGVELKYPNVS